MHREGAAPEAALHLRLLLLLQVELVAVALDALELDDGVARVAPLAALGPDLGCQGTRYVRCARGWYAYLVRAVRGALGTSHPSPVRTQTRRLGRGACTYGGRPRVAQPRS